MLKRFSVRQFLFDVLLIGGLLMLCGAQDLDVLLKLNAINRWQRSVNQELAVLWKYSKPDDVTQEDWDKYRRRVSYVNTPGWTSGWQVYPEAQKKQGANPVNGEK